MTHYCIVEIATGKKMYSGMSCISAAFALEPGTCWGQGESKWAALAMAQGWAEWFRKRAAA